MAYSEMSVAPALQNNARKFAFEYSETLVAPGNGTSILVPAGVATVSVQVDFSNNGTGKVQTTVSSVAIVKAGTAIWGDWDAGTVSTHYEDVCVPVTAVRLVQVGTGSATISVRAQ